ncbi:uncharacterized protein LOC132311774 [Cornus florida]|uniref:uncharacterized protein LOC132311774 n=1 Tax=Cornus florida TaxID=4283 RepID=UPI00289A45DB|nr:uncharacterized protein LOC132311774 [Cornus florida]
MSPKFQVKLKERQSQEDEDDEKDEDPAIRLYKDTHFKEQGGWAYEKAKRNFDAMKENTAQNSQNSDGTSPSTKPTRHKEGILPWIWTWFRGSKASTCLLIM